ncbi:FAD-dependent oxidoreductase [Terriglobus roseus]|nr:FAD-binding oxidoreductase [Terriglobus roseus]
MPDTVLRTDPRFPLASRTRNARFPSSDAQLAGRVEYCLDAEDVAHALQATLDAGLRPTVRSSGHCYEDFVVNNPNGAILDVSSLDRVQTDVMGKGSYSLGPGTMLGRAYEQLYKRGGVCIPGGTCYTVTAGGHISGGGYGTLVRQYGLTVDWVTAIDVVTVDQHGRAVPRRVSKQSEPHLFRALRGGQGSNFGVITNFHFDHLPPTPQEVVHASVSWDWKDMTEEKFVSVLLTYGKWMAENSAKKETWGLFAGLYLSNKTSGRITMRAELMNPNGPVTDLSVLYDLCDKLQPCKPLIEKPSTITPNVDDRRGPPPGDSVCYGDRPVDRQPWLESTLQNQGGSTMAVNRGRAKYKSSYMKANFTEEEARSFYHVLSDESTRGVLVAIDSYGGATNNPDRIHDTAVPQRSSVMKLQYMSFWGNEADDAFRLKGIRDLYNNVYSTGSVPEKYKGTPFPGEQYDGCYINYPDADMLQHDFWPQLYYGTGELYPFLQQVKREYDPHNIFHHAMAIQA